MAELDGATDIYSPNFNPREALLCAQLRVPYPDVQPLNNLAECRRLLPRDARDALPEAKLRALQRTCVRDAHAPPVAHEEAARAAAPAVRSRGRPDPLGHGPLQLAKRLLGSRVCVVTRHRNCVRGTCTGLLMAVDRHLNLLLFEAEDVFVPAHDAAARTGETGELLDASAGIARAVRGMHGTHSSHGQLLVRRRFGQVLFRGESVVLVFAAP
ncbi:hypothetical protein KFE25_003136 [Diacronema lutheri]|uniref:LSM domain-containing protein n=1 Tax=Diacronema lutheri TaxID=2081491 RepID=A0A8J6C3X1_DIALT|nr:hypothetical protein KFE25_003136 [Diacronema lutheri]